MKIEFKDVHFSYDNDTNQEVLKNISFTINQNEMVAILGHNGSGKSTIAKLIMGLINVKSGDIYLDNVLVTDKSITEDTLDMLHSKMGIVFQNPDNQFVGLTVEDDIAFGLENHNVERDEMIKRIHHFAKVVNMEEFLNKNPEDLSGGQKQRVAIAGILAMDPEVIIFDESTSMLDPRGTKEIIDMIKMLKNSMNKTIITITHNLEEACFADRVMVLNDGEIVLDGTPKEVLNERAILEKSGLKLLDSLSLIDKLKDESFKDKDEVLKTLWELTFKN